MTVAGELVSHLKTILAFNLHVFNIGQEFWRTRNPTYYGIPITIHDNTTADATAAHIIYTIFGATSDSFDGCTYSRAG